LVFGRIADQSPQNKLRNPYAILRELTSHQWLMFAAGFLGWTWDSFDFFTVSMTITEISETFGVSYSDVSWVGLLGHVYMYLQHF
jgi:SHS family lactate transporter-like MFS transporter